MALAASVLFPLVLVPQLGLMRSSLFFGLINVAIAIVLCFLLGNMVKNRVGLRFRSIFAFLLLLLAFMFAEDILSYSEGKLYGEDILYKKSTPYQRIVLTRAKSDIHLYLNNNLQFSSKDEYRYHESLVHPAMSLAPKTNRVLVLGGGDGLALREILKYEEVQEITLVDLDRAITDLFKTKVWGVINFGLVFAWSEFIVAWGLAWIYARRANAEFDALAAEINRDAMKNGGNR